MNVQLLKFYSLQGLARAVDIFNAYTTFTPIHKVLGYRFLLQHGHKEPRMAPPKEEVIRRIKEMVDEHWRKDETEEGNSTIMDLVDLLVDFAPEEGDKLLAKLRELKTVANKYGPCQEGPAGTIYADSQTGHDSKIKSSAVRAATKLVRENPFIANTAEAKKEKMQKYEMIKDSMIILAPGNEEEMRLVMERIEADNAIYGPDEIMCDEVFLSLNIWIENQTAKGKNMQGIQQRLLEELLEMYRYCSSRILEGLINVMQGFADEPDYQITISSQDQCKAVIYNYINLCLKECRDEEVMEGMLDYSGKYIMFVKGCVNKKMLEWKREYGQEFFDLIKPVVNEYVKTVIY